MIVVIDYNVGNVKSVCNAFRYNGCEVELSKDPETIRNATGIVLPGVAAFGYAVNALGPIAKVVKEVANYMMSITKRFLLPLIPCKNSFQSPLYLLPQTEM